MSNESSSSLPPSFTQPTYSWKIQNFATPPVLASPVVLETTWQSNASLGNRNPEKKESAKERKTSGVRSTSTAAKKESVGGKPVQKRRRLNPEDEETRKRTASAVALSLATDHILALYPDADTPFIDEVDVVNRLLPYHVYQYPKDDLMSMMSDAKGKAKATCSNELQEYRESKFAINCYKRFRTLEKRFRNARIKAGEYPSPHDQAIHLERMVAEGDRAAKTFLDQDLAAAKSEFDKQLRAKRVTSANASRQAAQAQAAQATAHLTGNPTPSSSTSTSNFYGFSNKPIMSTHPGTSFSHYYSSYSYPYTQTMPYNATALSYPMNTNLPTTPTPISSLKPVATAPTTFTASSSASTAVTTQQPTTAAAPASTIPAPASSSTLTPASSSQPTPPSTRPPVTIPLQIPVTSLPALRALGILPVPKAALPPPSDPQPAAVLIGSTAGGTMLSIEVNAALLQAPQMSGLAILLSGLVQLGGGDAASATATTGAPVAATGASAPASVKAASTNAATSAANNVMDTSADGSSCQ